jgi:hypothetical protein
MRETPEIRVGQAGQARDHGCRASSNHAVSKMKRHAHKHGQRREMPEFRAGQARDHGCRASYKHAVRKMKRLAPGA